MSKTTKVIGLAGLFLVLLGMALGGSALIDVGEMPTMGKVLMAIGIFGILFEVIVVIGLIAEVGSEKI